MIQSRPVMRARSVPAPRPPNRRPARPRASYSLAKRMPDRPSHHRRQRRTLRRLGALGGVAAVAFLVGVISGATHEPAERGLAANWTQAWRAGDYRSMYALLTSGARAKTSLERFTATYRDAATTATLSRVATGRPRVGGERIVVPTDATTRIFGHVRGNVVLPVAEDDSSGEPRVDWLPQAAFPGLRAGEKLTRETTLPPRATILARDGTPLAEGASRL